MKNAMSLLAGLACGAVVGAGLAILFAPATGEETRQQIRDRVQYVQDEVRKAAEQRRAEMETQLAELRSPYRPSAKPSTNSAEF